MEFDVLTMAFQIVHGIWHIKGLATISPTATAIVLGVVGLKRLLR